MFAFSIELCKRTVAPYQQTIQTELSGLRKLYGRRYKFVLISAEYLSHRFTKTCSTSHNIVPTFFLDCDYFPLFLTQCNMICATIGLYIAYSPEAHLITRNKTLNPLIGHF